MIRSCDIAKPYATALVQHTTQMKGLIMIQCCPSSNGLRMIVVFGYIVWHTVHMGKGFL